jgi:hypothetical protein
MKNDNLESKVKELENTYRNLKLSNSENKK